KRCGCAVSPMAAARAPPAPALPVVPPFGTAPPTPALPVTPMFIRGATLFAFRFAPAARVSAVVLTAVRFGLLTCGCEIASGSGVEGMLFSAELLAPTVML